MGMGASEAFRHVGQICGAEKTLRLHVSSLWAWHALELGSRFVPNIYILLRSLATTCIFPIDCALTIVRDACILYEVNGNTMDLQL